MSNKSILLPCSHCGGPAALIEGERAFHGRSRVECQHCRIGTFWWEPGAAVDMWNKRTNPADRLPSLTMPALPHSHMRAELVAAGVPLTFWYTLDQMEEYAALVAARAASNRQPDDWKPMSTAPTDGTPVIVYGHFAGARVPIEHIAAWHANLGGWVAQTNGPLVLLEGVTHWMPRPGVPRQGVPS